MTTPAGTSSSAPVVVTFPSVGTRTVYFSVAPAVDSRGQTYEHIGEGGPVSAGLCRLVFGPRQLVEDNPLHMLQALGGRQLVIHDLRGAFQATTLEVAIRSFWTRCEIAGPELKLVPHASSTHPDG